MLTDICFESEIKELTFSFNEPIKTINLPIDVVILIFSKLGNRELAKKIFVVSKSWNFIASHDTLWSAWAICLLDNSTINQGKNKEIVVGKINLIKQSIKNTNDLLKTNISQSDQKELKKSILEMFKDSVLLSKMGLIKKEGYIQYGEYLQTNWSSYKAWEWLANDHLSHNELEKAKSILQTRLPKSKDFYFSMLSSILSSLCTSNQFNSAFELFKESFDFFINFQNLDRSNNKCFMKNANTVSHAFLKQLRIEKQCQLYEKVVTTILLFYGRAYFQIELVNEVLDLIQTLLEEKQEKAATEFIATHLHNWEDNLNKTFPDPDQSALFLYFSRMIPIYIQIKEYKRAQMLALKDPRESKDSLKQLHQVFLEHDLPHLAKEVEKKL